VHSPTQYSRFATALNSTAPDQMYRCNVNWTGRVVVSRKSRSGGHSGIKKGSTPPPPPMLVVIEADADDDDNGNSTHSVHDRQTSDASPIPVVVDDNDVPIASAILLFVDVPLFVVR
jgi:hypothetical protein